MTVTYDPRRKKWRYNFRLNGERHSRYCVDPATGKPAANKTQAKAIEDKIRARLMEGLGHRRATPMDYTVAQAFAVFLTQRKNIANYSLVAGHVRELVSWLGPQTLLSNITERRIQEYITWAQHQKIKVWLGGPSKLKNIEPESQALAWKTSDRTRSDSVINRYLTTLRTTLKIAHDTRDPRTGLPLLPFCPRVPRLKEPKRLPRPIASHDIDALIAAAPPHLADALRLTVLMGFRRAEVFGLKVGQVDLNNRGVWLKAEQTKGNRDEFIPASAAALDILKRLKKQAEALGMENLILYRRGGIKTPMQWLPCKNAKRSWHNALKKCGLNGQHVFHSTKASFVSAIAQKMPAAIVQDLARHKDFATTQRYLRVTDTLRRDGVEAAASFYGGNVIPMRRGKTVKTGSELHTKVTHKKLAQKRKTV